MSTLASQLSTNLQKLNTGIIGSFTAGPAKVDAARVMPMFSGGVLASEGLASNPALVQLSQQVTSHLYNARTLMSQLGVSDITKAPAISISSPLRVVPGYYHTNPGFDSNSVLPVDSSVIIASTLDLTQTTLTIDPSVNTLTIIVETLTCGQGALITYDDSSVWQPFSLPATNAPDGISYNPNGYGVAPTTAPMAGTERRVSPAVRSPLCRLQRPISPSTLSTSTICQRSTSLV